MDNKILTLLTVYETRSFTKAAKKLCLTQPAVSQHIKQLESEFDIKIFVRTDHELKPTPEGEILVKYGLRLQAMYANIARAISDAKQHKQTITIGLTPTAELNVITSVFFKLFKEQSSIRIIVITDTLQGFEKKLKSYEIDIAIVDGRIADSSLNSVLLDNDSLILVTSADHPFANKEMVTLDELTKEKLIIRLPGSGTRTLFEASLASNNRSIEEFNVIVEVDNVATIKELVQHNLGVSILARSACLEEAKDKRLRIIPVKELSMNREINIVCNKDFEHQEILDLIKRIYKTTIKDYQTDLLSE